MPDSPEKKPAASSGRIPTLAIATVALGVLASLAIYGLYFIHGSGSLETDWDTSETIASPDARQVGDGSFTVSRTSLSAIAPNEDGLLLFRIAGIVRVESNGEPADVRCSVKSGVAGDTRLARASRLRAAWPRSTSELDLHRQDVPESSSVKYRTEDSKKIELPIRDVIQRYVDSNALVTVEWEGYVEDEQTWIWHLPDGSGVGATTLPWAVIFESETRPKGTIECKANIGDRSTRITIPYRQEEWPIADDQPNTGDAEAGDATNVQ